MSLIVKTEAVVLRTIRYGESSKIVTFFTRSHGKISAIVKGARSQKKRYGSPIDTLSYVWLIFYHKEGRDLQTVSQCDTLHTFRRIPEDMEKISAGMTAAELIYRFTPQHEQNTVLFKLFADVLQAIDDATKNPMNLLYYFEYHFIRILGFEMSTNSCVACGRIYRGNPQETKKIVFDLDRGGILCSACRDDCRNPFILSSATIDFLTHLSGVEASSVNGMKCGGKSKQETEKFLWSYLKFHMPELDRVNSAGVFAALIKNG